MKFLIVGDPHVEPGDLGDCSALMTRALVLAEAEAVDAVVILGDLYHTHSVMRVEVLSFWKSVFKSFQERNLKVIALVGNHDLAGSGNAHEHALLAHVDDCLVISQPRVWEQILFVPYMADTDAFVRVCEENKAARTVICHQTFSGAAYGQGGFYAKDGIDASRIPQAQILSGHIHTAQSFGKVFYPGSPRWKTLGDADTDKSLWVLEFEDGVLLKTVPFSTEGICRKICRRQITPKDTALVMGHPKLYQYHVDIQGPPAFVEEQKQRLAGSGVRIRTLVEEVQTLDQISESEGVPQAFRKFLARFQPVHGTTAETLGLMARERGLFL